MCVCLCVCLCPPSSPVQRIFYLSAIPNYPADNLPTILVYHKHDIALSIVTLRQLGGLDAIAGANGERIMCAALSTCGAVPPLHKRDVIKSSSEGAGTRSESDDDVSD